MKPIVRIEALAELVEWVRERSPFYRELYSEVPLGPGLRISDLPIVDQNRFWAANGLRDNRVLTAPLKDGIVFKSGGTTGNPKFSVYSMAEWQAFTRAFGWGMSQGALRGGDRVANLFYAGELYASFLFITRSLETASLEVGKEPALHLPVAGSTPPEAVLKILADFEVDVVAGAPTTLLSLAECYCRDPDQFPGVRLKKALFGGESMYEDQRRWFESVFPGIRIHSIGYASVDAGLLGYADPECGPDEHWTFGDETLFEIVDEESGEVIDECGRVGRVVVTSLIRRVMPIIRYPAGDRAMWMQDPQGSRRKFKIVGRSEEAARVGPVSIYYEDIRKVLLNLSPAIGRFQLILAHRERRDELKLRIEVLPSHESSVPGLLKSLEGKISDRFNAERPMFRKLAESGKIHFLAIEWVSASDLLSNPRTGKLKRVVDLRSVEESSMPGLRTEVAPAVAPSVAPALTMKRPDPAR